MKKNSLSRSVIVCLFLVFSVFALLQYRCVFPLFDDYGYASLSYAKLLELDDAVSLANIFRFLRNHYLGWGGRVLMFFLEICLLQAPRWCICAFFSIVLVFLMYSIFYIGCDRDEKWYMALLTCSLYGCFTISFVNEGIYWYTAGILYVVPLVPLLWGSFLYSSNNYYQFSNFKKTQVSLLLFVASFSQEQISVIVCCVVFWVFFCRIIFRKIQSTKDLIWNIANICTVTVGLLLLAFSPGSMKRLHGTNKEEISFITKTITNASNILGILFGKDNSLYLCVFCLVGIALATLIWKNTKYSIIKRIQIIFGAISVLFECILFSGNGLFETVNHLFEKEMVVLFFLLYGVSFVIEVVFFSFIFGEKLASVLFVAAFSSIVLMFLFTEITPRTTIPFMFLSFPFFILVFNTFINTNKKRSKTVILGCILSILCTHMGYNLVDIYLGYSQNYQTNRNNDELLCKASEDIKNGVNIDYVILGKLPVSECKPNMPYDYDNGITVWMHKYYDIPQNVLFAWE